MGLFSNKNKPCPLCGKPTPRLLATKIQGDPLCGDCSGAMLADDELMKSWTLDDARAHLEYRAENKRLVDNFPATRTLDYGREMVIDDNGKQFFIREWAVDNPPVIRFDEIQGFQLELGWETVESWSRGMQRTPYLPPELGTLGTLASLADVFSRDKDQDDDSRSETIQVKLILTNPYLREYELLDASAYGRDELDFNRSLAEEMSRANIACNMLVAMANGIAAPVSAPTAAPAPAAQAADDILKFKSLLDAGAITQEEFNSKKKQLLGI